MMKIYNTLLLLCFPTIVFSQDLIKMGYEPIYEDGLNERKRVVFVKKMIEDNNDYRLPVKLCLKLLNVYGETEKGQRFNTMCAIKKIDYLEGKVESFETFIIDIYGNEILYNFTLTSTFDNLILDRFSNVK